MENEKTFGRFLVSKRQENEISARQLAIALDYSAVYICDIEKDRRPVPDEILERLPTLLHLNETETDEMYDLAAKSRNTVSADLPEYIMEKDIVRAALRTAKKNNVTDKQWEDFIRRITKSPIEPSDGKEQADGNTVLSSADTGNHCPPYPNAVR